MRSSESIRTSQEGFYHPCVDPQGRDDFPDHVVIRFRVIPHEQEVDPRSATSVRTRAPHGRMQVSYPQPCGFQPSIRMLRLRPAPCASPRPIPFHDPSPGTKPVTTIGP